MAELWWPQWILLVSGMVAEHVLYWLSEFWSPMYVKEDWLHRFFEGHWTLDVLLYAFEVLYIESEAWHNCMVHRSSRCFKQLQWPIQKSCNYLVEPKREKGYLVSESFMFCLKETISSCRGACSQSRSSQWLLLIHFSVFEVKLVSTVNGAYGHIWSANREWRSDFVGLLLMK